MKFVRFIFRLNFQEENRIYIDIKGWIETQINLWISIYLINKFMLSLIYRQFKIYMKVKHILELYLVIYRI